MLFQSNSQITSAIFQQSVRNLSEMRQNSVRNITLDIFASTVSFYVPFGGNALTTPEKLRCYIRP